MTDPGGSSADQKVAQRRVWRAVIGWGWQAAPGWTVYTAALLVGNAVCTVLYPVGFALIIDAALRHQLGYLVLGMVSVVVLYTLSWALAMFAGVAGSVLSDRVTFFLSAHIAEQINAERPERMVVVHRDTKDGIGRAYLAGGVIVVEYVFNYAGIGGALQNAVSTRDLPVVQALAMLIAALYVVLNMLADIATILVTPKLRTRL